RRKGLAQILERTGRGDGGRRNLRDGGDLAALFLGRGTVGQVQEPGEEQPEHKGQSNQASELEPVQGTCGHRPILLESVSPIRRVPTNSTKMCQPTGLSQ